MRELDNDKDLAERIERFLLERGDWVKADEICARFGVDERRLRQMYDRPGLCTAFAISLSNQGFKHVALATTEEWLHAKHAAKREAIARLRRIKTWQANRRSTATICKRLLIEIDTGQILLPL